MNLGYAFCVTGKTGLGHLRRITNVALALRRRQPSAPLRLFTNAPPAGLTKEERTLFETVDVAPRDQLAPRISETHEGSIIVDTAGVPGLDQLTGPLCLILRETIVEKLGVFRLGKGRLWDLVCIPNPDTHWLPDADAIGAKKVCAVGWIYREARLGQAVKVNPCSRSEVRTLLIASGGGGNRESSQAFRKTLEPLIRSVRAKVQNPLKIVQVLGPRAPQGARIDGINRILKPGPKLNEAFRDADLVITTVGYNSVLELASTDVPALLVPIRRSFDDQSARAAYWSSKLGLDHSAKYPERSVEFMVSNLNMGRRRPPVELGPSGAIRCAALIEELGR